MFQTAPTFPLRTTAPQIPDKCGQSAHHSQPNIPNSSGQSAHHSQPKETFTSLSPNSTKVPDRIRGSSSRTESLFSSPVAVDHAHHSQPQRLKPNCSRQHPRFQTAARVPGRNSGFGAPGIETQLHSAVGNNACYSTLLLYKIIVKGSHGQERPPEQTKTTSIKCCQSSQNCKPIPSP